ncbi:hypothetical protein Cni_G00624 [Canna indica]|uniref:EF-hand domain-containing protein n=1 Tax=Canna indica TaxID=4628 RepID=A0AAQ3JMR8_9LILI|nr:hypothetical protein Cni_G00624 [Canna indica]
MKSLISAAAFLLLLFAAAGSKAQAQTPLQKHAAFFDANKDGKVYPSETYSRLRAIGLDHVLSLGAGGVINGFMGPRTSPDRKFCGMDCALQFGQRQGWISSKGDSSKAEEQSALQKHVSFFDKNNDGIIYPSETYNGMRAIGVNIALAAAGSALINGFLSPKTSPERKFCKWNVLYNLCKDKDGFLQKETIRKVIDGSLFYELQKANQSSLKQ